MPHLLVPLEAKQKAATLWVGVVGSAPGVLSLDGGGVGRRIEGGWREWQTHGVPRLWYQRLELEGLQPGSRYPLRLLEGGAERAGATATTLPDRLPTIDEPPFICLVGSCFARDRDASGAAGAAYASLPAAARPQVKFLCGDQVYLDAPFPKFQLTRYGDEDLRADLLACYLATWTQGGGGGGYSEILRTGATFFTSDDHEFWNNAPRGTPTVRNSWTAAGRATWHALATDLYRTFQATSPSASFTVGSLSLRVIDTRVERSEDGSAFVSAGELQGLAAWVDGLGGPGVLVVGQVVLAERGSWWSRFVDMGLPDIDQYGEFVRILQRARHDVVVLTGDVHYGRVAGCTLPTGAQLIEIIASPFSLVDPRVGGRWKPAPDGFPSFPIAGSVRCDVWSAPDHRLATNQFATVEFAADGARVRVTVRAWPVSVNGTRPSGTAVYSRTLQ
ncbi:MAG: hypothetical protein M3452_01600 [Chloroflexota bacterium]|nr:hypothetical protein [Chloroflexota bacterium]